MFLPFSFSVISYTVLPSVTSLEASFASAFGKQLGRFENWFGKRFEWDFLFVRPNWRATTNRVTTVIAR